MAFNFLLLIACQGSPTASLPPVSFRDEVMPLLSQGGCNSGPCHGNLNGKGGFKLSLRGENPRVDWETITHGESGRRVNTPAASQSLLLQKASGHVPHEGGTRWATGGPAWSLVQRWISQGCPTDRLDKPVVKTLQVEPKEVVVPPRGGKVSLRALAGFADGSSQSVTHLITVEASDPAIRAFQSEGTESGGTELLVPAGSQAAILVRYGPSQALVRVWSAAGPAFAAPSSVHPIDQIIHQRLAGLGIHPAAGVDDSKFLRRIWLDLAGQLPPPNRTRAFLADNATDKRAREVDFLLDQPAFSDVWALHWADMLRVEEKTLDAKGVRVMHGWLRQAFLDRMPLDEMARQLISARGSTYQNPPANFYRALRDPQTRAEAVAQVFLGVRIACARCHNHPFDRWTTEDYFSFSGLFGDLDYQIVENKRADDLDKHEFKGEQIVFLRRGPAGSGGKKAGGQQEKMPPAFYQPRYLGENSPVTDLDKPAALAAWLTGPANPFFAKAQANRIWRRLMGRGLVEPEDDARLANPPSNPELLDHLAERLTTNGFDARSLVRHITLSEAYARGLDAAHAQATQDDGLCAAQPPRPLTAEQLLDAWSEVLESPLGHAGYPKGTRTLELPGMPGPSRRRKSEDLERFLRTFGKPERLLSCDCERTAEPTLAQTLFLVSGQLPQRLLSGSGRLARLAGGDPAESVEELYLAALCRYPTAREKAACLELIGSGKDRRLALEDLAWALLGSREFLVRW